MPKKDVRGAAELAELTHTLSLAQVLIRTVTGEVVFWGEGAERLYGWSRPEVLGKNVQELLATRFAQPAASIEEKFLNEGRWQGEVRSRRKDGSEVIIASQWTLQHFEGHLDTVVEVNSDVTELRRSEERNKAFLRTSAEGFWCIGFDKPVATSLPVEEQAKLIVQGGRVIEANDVVARTFGFQSSADCIGVRLVDLLPGSDVFIVHAFVQGGYRHTDIPSRIFTPNNKERFTLSNAVGIVEDGDLVRVWGTQRDITKMQFAQESLRRSEERLRLAQQAAGFGIWDWDLESNEMQWSPEIYEFLGLPRSTQPSLDRWLERVHPDDCDRVRAEGQAVIEGLGDLESYCRVVRQNGSVRWILRRVKVYANQSGLPSRMVGVAMDLTERKETEEALKRANADLEQFAYSASHDLKEPLQNISGWTDLLTEAYAGGLDERGRKFLQHISDSEKRMETLIQDLLEYTKTGSAEADLRVTTDAGDALQGALANLEQTIRETEAEIVTDPLPMVKMRRVHLQQMFQNLISNSIKYRGTTAPRIRVSARRADGVWRFSLSDNGIGISPEDRERVFGLFRRVHSGPGYPGSGLGLCICRRLAERYGGRIWVESEGEGKGSTFFFIVPVGENQHSLVAS